MSVFRDLFDVPAGTPLPADKMPSIFVGHGNPMNAIEDNEFSRGWAAIARTIPTPRAILCISAHWETRGTCVTTMERPRTIHDFYGFPRELFAVEYPAPGSPLLAESVKTSLAGVTVEPDNEWGLDHGCWSVIMKMYPRADIPVVQMSLDHFKPLRWHFELATELAVLRRRGVLIVGSGNMVHNLGMVDLARPEGGYEWAEEINRHMKESILAHHDTALTNIESLGTTASLAIPTAEHYIPMLSILGTRNGDEEIRFFNDKCVMGSLSMTSFVIG